MRKLASIITVLLLCGQVFAASHWFVSALAADNTLDGKQTQAMTAVSSITTVAKNGSVYTFTKTGAFSGGSAVTVGKVVHVYNGSYKAWITVTASSSDAISGTLFQEAASGDLDNLVGKSDVATGTGPRLNAFRTGGAIKTLVSSGDYIWIVGDANNEYTADATLLWDSDKSITVSSLNTSSPVTFKPSTNGVLLQAAISSPLKTFTWKYANIDLTNASTKDCFTASANQGTHVVVDHATLTSATGRPFDLTANTSAGRNVTLTNVTMSSSADNACRFGAPAASRSGTFKMSGDCHVTCTNTNDYSVFAFSGMWNVIDIREGTWTLKSDWLKFTTLTGFNSIRVTDNIVTATDITGKRYGVTPPVAAGVGTIDISRNMITQAGDATYDFVPISLGQYGTTAWTATKLVGARIIGNTITTVYSGAYGITCGYNVDGVCIRGNTISGGDTGIAHQGNFGEISYNRISCLNPLRLFGSSNMAVSHNSVISGTGAYRAMVFGRIIWFGTTEPTDTGNQSGSVFSTSAPWTCTITPSGGASLAITKSGFTAGYPMVLVCVNNSTETTRWGTISSIDTDTGVVTVDGWYDVGGLSATTPADGEFMCIATFPVRNTVTDNIFDAHLSSWCVTFDYIPFSTGHLFDYNIYRYKTGTNFYLSNLGTKNAYASQAVRQVTLAELKTEWASFQKTFTDNDAHSIDNSNPGFASTTPSNARFLAIPFGSAARGGASDSRSDIGAWQRKEQAQQSKLEP